MLKTINRAVIAAMILAFLCVIPSALHAQSCTPGNGVMCSPNLNLWIPPLGYGARGIPSDNSWGTVVNVNFSLLDSAVIKTLTTTGTSGPATFSSGILNIPEYTAGTLTGFTAGSLSPLFTTSVATPNTTPALSFTLSAAAANTVFGNFTGTSAAPTFSATPAFSGANITALNATNLASGTVAAARLPLSTTLTWTAAQAFSAGITVTHIAGSGTSPTVAAQAGAGTGATANIDANAHDSSGTITLVTGTSPTSESVQVILTFGTAFTTAPHCVLTADNEQTANAVSNVYKTQTTTALSIATDGAALGSGSFVWDYICQQ